MEMRRKNDNSYSIFEYQCGNQQEPVTFFLSLSSIAFNFFFVKKCLFVENFIGQFDLMIKIAVNGPLSITRSFYVYLKRSFVNW